MSFIRIQGIFTVMSAALATAFVATLITKRKNHRSFDVLIFALIVMQIHQGLATLITRDNYQSQLLFQSLIAVNFLSIPIPYIYVKSFTDPEFSLRSVFVPHILVFFSAIGIFFLYRVWDPYSNLSDPQNEIYLAVFLAASVAGPYVVSIHRLIIDHEKFLRANFSDLSQIKLSWLKILLSLLYISLAFQLTDVLTGPQIPLWKFMPMLATVAIFCMTYFSLTHSKIIEDVTEAEKSMATSSEAHFSAAEIERYKKKILEYLDEKRGFLNPQLNLRELSSAIGLKAYKTSELINACLGTNFYTLVNSRRVEWAKKMLVDPGSSHLSILGIANNSGFNTKSVFNDVFKKLTHVTPREYRASKLAEKTT